MGIKRFVWVLPPGDGDRWEAGMACRSPRRCSPQVKEAQGSTVFTAVGPRHGRACRNLSGL